VGPVCSTSVIEDCGGDVRLWVFGDERCCVQTDDPQNRKKTRATQTFVGFMKPPAMGHTIKFNRASSSTVAA